MSELFLLIRARSHVNSFHITLYRIKTRLCCLAYEKFTADYTDYDIDVFLCAFTSKELTEAHHIWL